MLKLRYFFSSVRSQSSSLLKERLFILQTSITQSQSLQTFTETITAFLNEKIYDQVLALKYIDNTQLFSLIKEQIETIQNKDDILLDVTIKYLELNFLNPKFQEEIQWLLNQPINDEYKYIILSQFFSGILVNNQEIYNKFKDKEQENIFQSILVQIIDYCIKKQKQPQLNENKINELKKYLNIDNDRLKCYASLFLSKYDTTITNFKKFSCHPEILLILFQNDEIPQSQFKFIISQIQQGVNQWHMNYLAELLLLMNKQKPNQLFVKVIHQIYVERVINQEQNIQFDLRILKNFVQVAQKNQTFQDFKIYLMLLKRAINIKKSNKSNLKNFENIIRTIYFALRELAINDSKIFDQISQAMLTDEYYDIKKGLEEWLQESIIAESISIINMFQLIMPDGFFNNYLKNIPIKEKLLRSIIRLLNQSKTFQLTEENTIILENYITQFKLDYLKYIQPANLINYPKELVKKIVTAIIKHSSDDSIIDYIIKNINYLKNNQTLCKDIGLDFQHMAGYVRFQIDAQFTSKKVNIDQLCKLIMIYNIMAEFDDDLIEKMKKLIQQSQPIEIANILMQSDQLREKLKDFQELQNIEGQNTFIDIYLKGQGTIPKEINTIDDILITNAKCQQLGYYQSKQLRKQLIQKLQNINQIPTKQQAYELILGLKASDFSNDTYEKLLKMVMEDISNLDCKHIYKLLNKLVQQQKIFPGIMIRAYQQLQKYIQSDLSQQQDKLSILRLAYLLKRIYPYLTIDIQEQENEEGKFINQIIENMYSQGKNELPSELKSFMNEYKEFFPFFYQDQKEFDKYFLTFKDKLNISIFGYINNLNLEVNRNDLIQELKQPLITAIKQLQLACLISKQQNNEEFKMLLKNNFKHIDPHTNYLFQEDLIVYFEVLKELFPKENFYKKLEQFLLRTYDTLHNPTLRYFLTQSLLTNRTISFLEDNCLK